MSPKRKGFVCRSKRSPRRSRTPRYGKWPGCDCRTGKKSPPTFPVKGTTCRSTRSCSCGADVSATCRVSAIKLFVVCWTRWVSQIAGKPVVVTATNGLNSVCKRRTSLQSSVSIFWYKVFHTRWLLDLLPVPLSYGPTPAVGRYWRRNLSIA